MTVALSLEADINHKNDDGVSRIELLLPGKSGFCEQMMRAEKNN
jgi:hypothetical protein